MSTAVDNTKKDNFLNAPKSLQKEIMKKDAPEDLKHVKENDLVHGEFGKWLENVGMHRQQAYRFIKIADEFSNSNSTPVLHLGVKALYQLATMPEEQRNHVIENGIETNNGNKSIDEATTRELEEYKKQLKQRDEEKYNGALRSYGQHKTHQLATMPEEQRNITLTIVKNKLGETGCSVDYKYYPAYNLFEELV